MSCRENESKPIDLKVSAAAGKCGIGEKVGKENMKTKSVPVLSCEGACIRGEIARNIANSLSKRPGYKRGCHGELFTIADSSISEWIRSSEKVICIDGCFLKCHYRILENIIEKERIVSIDALSYYNLYNDIFDINDVPEEERAAVSKTVTEKIAMEL